MPRAPRSRLDALGKQLLVEVARIGERLRFAALGRPAADTAIVLAGSGRSGTTWLAGLLASATGVQTIFEPLYPRWSPEVRRLTGWDGRIKTHAASYYLRPDADAPDWRTLLGRVLTGRERSYWTDYDRQSLFPSRFLVKLIRGNQMLGYIHENFRPAIVYVTRHPCAVVASKVRMRWHADVDDILSQDELVADHLSSVADEVARERDPLGAHAVAWAVENGVAGRQLAGRPHYRLTYEELCLRPVETARSVAAWLGLELPRRIGGIARRPSRLTRKDRLELSTEERLSAWTRELDDGEVRRVLDWAGRLGLTDYDAELLPKSVRASR